LEISAPVVFHLLESAFDTNRVADEIVAVTDV